MVRTRVSKFAQKGRDTFSSSLKFFGREDITLTVKGSRNTDSMGNLTSASTDTTSTIKGDLQFGPEVDSALLEAGWVSEGEGVFYCAHSVSLSENDILTVDSVDWVLVRHLRSPRAYKGVVVHQEWVCQRKD